MNSRGSKASTEERAVEENTRLAEVIAESNYVNYRMKMEYDKNKLKMEKSLTK